MDVLFLETDKRSNLWNKNVSNEKLISNHCYPQNYDFARNRSLGSKKRGGAKRNSLPVIHPRFRFESTEPRLAGRLDAEARLLIKIWRSARQSQPLWLYESSCNNNR